MKKLYEKIIWRFFSIPRHASDWAAQNEWRISVFIGIILLFMLFGILSGYLHTWEVR